MSLTSFLNVALNGLTFGALLFFLASGFTLIFGLMRVVNLGHGAFYMLGGYVGISTILLTGNYWLGVLAGSLAVAVVGVLTERWLLRPIRGLQKSEVLLTIGLTFVIGDLALAGWGGNPRPVPVPSYLSGSIALGPMIYPRYRIFVLVLAIVVGIALFLLLHRTRVGAVVRAGVDDREIVQALGVDINLAFTGVFALGSFLAGLAGVIGGGMLSLLPGVEFEILLLGLVVVIIGGLGSLTGAVLGAILVGLVDSFTKAFIPDLAFFTLFAPMALVLYFRPRGLLGKL